ncbi:hypothetical protein [Neobacillus sp. YIM B06451]|uniref:hypothetical protein n=1 Tax=Neobacillus sp. YIM B06451 TaxID=3070994 RepID=UPI00292D66DE|nr:hypothetical protein [Neobacillus sp. YIM B06451]
MQKKDQGRRSSYTFEDKGVKEVSTQIMNAYNSGFMGEEEARERTDEYPVMRDELE